MKWIPNIFDLLKTASSSLHIRYTENFHLLIKPQIMSMIINIIHNYANREKFGRTLTLLATVTTMAPPCGNNVNSLQFTRFTVFLNLWLFALTLFSRSEIYKYFIYILLYI